jgi:phage tail sheath protein FI
MADRVAILDAPPDMNPQTIRDWRMKEVNYDSKYGALYYPWIKVANPIGDGSIYVPPSGHMAGIWARNDSQRGVHKAPANEVVAGAIGLQYQTTHNEQSILNPVGINVIRSFPGRGIRVWGARTLSSDPSWRYLNVRRLFNYVSESLLLGTQWAVFEPNDRSLWEKLKRDVRAFLVRVYMDGALFGATPAEAFYVKCDEENNPIETRDVGQVIVEVGIAPVKPAEFVIIRLSQWQEGGSTS